MIVIEIVVEGYDLIEMKVVNKNLPNFKGVEYKGEHYLLPDPALDDVPHYNKIYMLKRYDAKMQRATVIEIKETELIERVEKKFDRDLERLLDERAAFCGKLVLLPPHLKN